MGGVRRGEPGAGRGSAPLLHDVPPVRALPRSGHAVGPEPIQLKLLIQAARQPTGAPLSRRLKPHRLQPHLHTMACGMCRDAAIGREQCQLVLPMIRFVKRFNDPAPRLALAVVDLPKVQHLTLNASPRRGLTVGGRLFPLSNAGVAVRFVTKTLRYLPSRVKTFDSMRISGVGRSTPSAPMEIAVLRLPERGPLDGRLPRSSTAPAIRHIDQVARRALGPVLDVAVEDLGAVGARLHVMVLPRGEEAGAFHAQQLKRPSVDAMGAIPLAAAIADEHAVAHDQQR